MNTLTIAYDEIYKSILTINPVVSYENLAQKFIDLSALINALPDDNDSWYYIGEGNESDLMNTVIGAFWHYSQWHSGQESTSYAALSALGSIYTPNMESEPTDQDDDGFNAFEQLEQLAETSQVYNKINKQFDDMLTRGIIPLFEYQIKKDEYLTVDIRINEKGILFSFDQNSLPVSFDGDIETISENNYLLPFDKSFDQLDSYLEMIGENMTEGYLLPNDLFYCED